MAQPADPVPSEQLSDSARSLDPHTQSSSNSEAQPIRSNPSVPLPTSPSNDRRPVRRRKKLLSKDLGSTDLENSSSDPSSWDDHDPPTSILLSPDIKLPITIQYLFVPSLNPSSNLNSRITYDHKLQSDHHVAKTSPLFSYFDGEALRPIREIKFSSSSNLIGSLSPKGKSRETELTKSTPSALSTLSSSNPILDATESLPDLKTYESPVKGELIEWCISEGQVLHERDGWRTRPVVKIKEPCTHAVQWHGQCAICGSDLTIGDYTGISETARASIPMSHGPSTLTVSVSEAQRLESETRTRLLKAQKLSLIVDLDQTIVHATVDPTVGEWMSDPNNPNWPALQDVSRFRLNDGPNINHEGCYYYLKQRPGLSEFLHSLADKYEMHVYTMGTRAYADAVCQIIDPTGEIFGNRILSRDESGSMTQKSINRLFPVDTSMVVIIDDRGDVWEYSPNLVSVVPYNFFVGIGDINGSFLPPARQLETSPAESDQLATAPNTQEDGSIPAMTVTDHSLVLTIPSEVETMPPSIGPQSDTLGESLSTRQACETSGPTLTTQAGAANTSNDVSQEDDAKIARSKLIADQVLTRPLKQKQIALQEAQRVQKIESRKRSNSSRGTVNSNHGGSSSTSKSVDSSRATTPVNINSPNSAPKSASALPPDTSSHRPNDSVGPVASHNAELDTTSAAQSANPTLTGLMAEGSNASSDDLSDSDANTDLSLLDEFEDLSERAVLVDHDRELNRLGLILEDIHIGFYAQDSIDQADARTVISALKHDVLQGVHLAFSSLWPMDAISEQQDAWKLAEQFGASCYTNLTPRVTHLVAAKLGTTKVNTALSRPNMAVVRPKWLFDAVTLWTRPPEDDYSWRSVLPSPIPLKIADEVEDDLGDWGVGMNDFDWKDAADEVMAALNESDDDTVSQGDHRTSSSDEGNDERGRARKRGRTSTRSSFVNSQSRESSRQRTLSTEPILADSPLSKRQRMARSRSSKLKLVVAADHQNEAQECPTPFDGSFSPQPQPETEPSDQDDDDKQSQLIDSHEGAGHSTDLSVEEDEFLSALAAEMEGNMANGS